MLTLASITRTAKHVSAHGEGQHRFGHEAGPPTDAQVENRRIMREIQAELEPAPASDQTPPTGGGEGD